MTLDEDFLKRFGDFLGSYKNSNALRNNSVFTGNGNEIQGDFGKKVHAFFRDNVDLIINYIEQYKKEN